MRLALFSSVLLLLLASKSFGQISQPDRYEIEVDNDRDLYTIVPADSDGLILVKEKPKDIQKNKVAWEHIVLDSALNKRRTDLVYVDLGYDLRGYDYNDKMVYLLYTANNNYSDYILEEYNPFTGESNTQEVKRFLNIDLTEFEVIDGNIVFAGYINTKPAVVLYSIDSARTKVLPGYFQEKSRLLQLIVSDRQKIIRVVTSIQLPGKRTQSINIRTFGEKGQMIDNYTLSPDENKNLITGRLVSLNDNENIIAGTYANRRTDYSRGIFLARIDASGDKTIHYYDYGDLQNFFSYMKAKRQQKIKDRIKRKKVKGQKAKFSYRLLVHDLIDNNGDYVLVGEAYYPTYDNNTFFNNGYGAYNYWGYPYYYGYNRNYYNTSFEGYSYTHAVIVGFDKKGKLLWDNSFEINDVKSYYLTPLVETCVKKDKIILLYNYENVIRSKIIEGNQVVEGKSFNDISLKFENDQVKNEDSKVGGLEHWYNDSFYAYGIQNIRNDKHPGVKLNRKVFFVNKIIYN